MGSGEFLGPRFGVPSWDELFVGRAILCLFPFVDLQRCRNLQEIRGDAADVTDHSVYRVWFSDGVREVGEAPWFSRRPVVQLGYSKSLSRLTR